MKIIIQASLMLPIIIGFERVKARQIRVSLNEISKYIFNFTLVFLVFFYISNNAFAYSEAPSLAKKVAAGKLPPVKNAFH